MLKHFGNILILCLCALIILSGSMPARGTSKSLPEFKLTQADRDYIASIKDAAIKLAYSYDALASKSPDDTSDGMITPIIDFMQDELGLKVELYKMGWSEARVALDSGEVDIYGFVALSKPRKEKYISTVSIFHSDAQIISRISEPIGSLAEIYNKKIGLMQDTVIRRTIETYLSDADNAIYYPSLDAMLDALESGEIDCIASLSDGMIEVLRRPEVGYEFSIENYYSDRGLISSNENLRQLFDIINRYVKSDDNFEKRIMALREEIIFHEERERLSKEIEFLKQRYDKITAFNSGAAYPLCYKENGVYKGLQVEINGVFEKLTGIEIEYDSYDGFEDGVYSTVEAVKSGEILFVEGAYPNLDINADPGFTYSPPYWTDTLRAYTNTDVEVDFNKMKVGSAPFVADYISWDVVSEQSLVMMNSRKSALDALKRKEIDIAFISEMCFDYMNIINNDFSLREIGNISAKAEIKMLYGIQNPEFNRLYDEAIKLYKTLYPRRTHEFKITAERYKSNYIRDRVFQYTMTYVVITVFLIMLLALIYLLQKYATYDRQISQLIHEQQTFDLVWVNLKKNRYVSKGGHAFFRKNGIKAPAAVCSLDEISGVLGWDLAEDYSEAVRKMKSEGSRFSVSNKKVSPQDDGKIIYYRRYLHLLSDHEYMSCLQDITDEMTRENELTQIATTDFLSNLLTRRAMDDLIIKKHDYISKNGGNAYLVMLDIDDFKFINDTFGHDVGDKVLVEVANVIQNTEGCQNTTSRWGGEEFLVLLECENVKIAEKLVNQMIVGISNRQIGFACKSVTVTASAGIARLDPQLEYTSSITRADEAMYKAKRSGKNCVNIL